MGHPPEDELADTATKQPLALTLGAAAVTLVVIIGVLTGPSVVYCFNAEEGMGQCLRGQMVQSGLLREPAVAALDPATQAEPSATPVTPQTTETAAPAPGATPAGGENGDGVVAATFGLLRAEPDGSVVIAGSGTPGSEVEVFANDDLLGSAIVEPSGDWVFVPATPLAPGELEITLGEAGKPGRSQESFVVAINEDKSSQPLVVASTPGAASEVLQGLEEPAEDTQVALAEPEPEPAPSPAPQTPPTADTPPLEPSAPETSQTAQAPQTPPANDSTVAAAPESPQQSEDTAAPEVTAPANLDVADLPEEVTPPLQPEAPNSAEAEAASEPAASEPPAETAVASAEPAPAIPAPTPAAADTTPPSIDAVEIEGDRTFFAGAGPEGADIRLYVDDEFIADAKVDGGRWLVEAGPVLKQPSQRVRIDMLEPGTSDVASRAEVNFVVELPVEPPVAVAQAETPAPTTAPSAPPPSTPPLVTIPVAPAPITEAPVASDPEPRAPEAQATPETEATPAQPTPTAPSAPAPEPAAAVPSVSPAATPSQQPATTTSPAPAPEPSSSPAATAPTAPAATTDASSAPASSVPVEPASAAAPEPAASPDVSAPAQPQPAAEQVSTPSAPPPAPAVVAAVPEPALDAVEQPAEQPVAPTAPALPETAAAAPPSTPSEQPSSTPVTEPTGSSTGEPEIPTMVAIAVGGPDAERFAAGKAIIRRGDNLWTIARRVYGQGVKYTTIYEANTGQIRDPNRIYPGQVFALPENISN